MLSLVGSLDGTHQESRRWLTSRRTYRNPPRRGTHTRECARKIPTLTAPVPFGCERRRLVTSVAVTDASLQRARPLLGRESQLAVATARLADLDASRGAMLLLTGEPGIGKTRLAEEVVALARERGYRSAWATAWQGEGAPPLWPWVQILRQLAGSEEMLSQFVAESPAASPAACFAQSEAISAVVRGVASERPARRGARRSPMGRRGVDPCPVRRRIGRSRRRLPADRHVPPRGAGTRARRRAGACRRDAGRPSPVG